MTSDKHRIAQLNVALDKAERLCREQDAEIARLRDLLHLRRNIGNAEYERQVADALKSDQMNTEATPPATPAEFFYPVPKDVS